jgi:hypothetical protein
MFRAVFWHVLMLIWLGALISGGWWIWPNFTKKAITFDLVGGVLWLAIGALAWVVAFNYGRQRYWRRH